MQKKVVLFIAGFLFFLNVICWQEFFALAGPQNLKVDFLNVGQGDSEFIQTPEGHKILIDGGPDSTVLSKLSSLLPFWDRSIDLVILTHPESDHMQGILDILPKYNVKYFLWTGVVKDAPEYKQLITLLQKAGNGQNSLLASLSNSGYLLGRTKVLYASAGEEIKAGSVLIDTLFPFKSLEGFKLTASANDTCVVSKIIYGKESFLFTGDIDSAAEKQLVNSGENISANVLKVAHHGSKYSTSDLFLAAVAPKIAVIEVGKNTYGHPTPEALQRLQEFGIKIFRTDQDGDVEFVSDGNNIKLLKN